MKTGMPVRSSRRRPASGPAPASKTVFKASHRVWDALLKGRIARWPDENVIRFLSAMYGGEFGGRSLLEMGCGNGRNVVWLAKEGFRVTGVDLSPEGVRITRARLRLEGVKARARIMDITCLAFPEESYDVVISDSAQITDDVPRALAEAYRVLKPGGFFMAYFRDWESTFSRQGRRVSRNRVILDERAGARRGLVYQFYTRRDVERLAREAGFEIRNMEKTVSCRERLSLVHAWWIVWCRKPSATGRGEKSS